MKKIKIVALVITASIATNNFGENKAISIAKQTASSVVSAMQSFGSSIANVFRSSKQSTQGILKSARSTVQTNLDKLSTNQKTGVAIVGGVIASYIVYKLIENNKTKKRKVIA